MNRPTIIKANGDEVAFDIEKLINSLTRAGASEAVANNIANNIAQSIFEGMQTKEIYKKAFGQLRKHSHSAAARYKLKKAIIELGPSGYPFEKFVSELLKAQGYQTKVGEIVDGLCVDHEIDVIAVKNNTKLMVECKFHSRQNRHCDVKIPLYIQSRFLDVSEAWRQQENVPNRVYQGCIFTNTRFTSDALQYGKCIGLKLVSWSYPQNGGIKELIGETGIHPITCMTTLVSKEKKALLEMGIVLCRDLVKKHQALSEMNVSKKRKQKIMAEASEVCSNLIC